MIDTWNSTRLILYIAPIAAICGLIYITEYPIFCLLLLGIALSGIHFIAEPFFKRQYFARFKDVSITDHFYPIVGDFKIMDEEFSQKGKFIGHYIRNFSLQDNPKKMHFLQMPNEDQLAINTPEVLAELDNKIPGLVDRFPIDNGGFGRVGGTGGIGQMQTNESWRTRREKFMKVIGINYASRYIPTFIKYLQANLEKFKVGDTIDISQAANTISFEIICAVLLGKDIEEKLDLCNYQTQDGSIKRMNLYECMMTITNDCGRAAFRLHNVLIPQLIQYDIGSENKRNTTNSDEIERVLKKFINESEDKNSVYHVVTEELGIDPSLTFKDTMAMLLGGHETTSKTFCSVLYFLKKYPSHLDIIRKELNDVFLKNGTHQTKDTANLFKSPTNFDVLFTRTNLDSLEYLTMFLKETLRYNPPACRSMGYKAKQAFKLDSVTVPKDQVIIFNVIGVHFNKDQWIDPLKFEPSRFDPTSKYFKKPDGNVRHPLSFIPFTFGTRACPGRSLGMMELKVLVSYFLLHFDYEIDQKFLDDPDVTFNIYSPYELNIKITKVYG